MRHATIFPIFCWYQRNHLRVNRALRLAQNIRKQLVEMLRKQVRHSQQERNVMHLSCLKNVCASRVSVAEYSFEESPPRQTQKDSEGMASIRSGHRHSCMGILAQGNRDRRLLTRVFRLSARDFSCKALKIACPAPTTPWCVAWPLMRRYRTQY